MSREINIEITKATISSFSVELNDDFPEVSATINLYASNGKKVSSFSATTKKYYGTEFELPIEMIEPIEEIASRLETILTRTCNREMALLEHKKESI